MQNSILDTFLHCKEIMSPKYYKTKHIYKKTLQKLKCSFKMYIELLISITIMYQNVVVVIAVTSENANKLMFNCSFFC